MNTECTCAWTGESGTQYAYTIIPIDNCFLPVPAHYILARQTPSGGWEPLSIGQTPDLAGLMAHLEQHPCTIAHAATHIHAHISAAYPAARMEEADLVAAYRPPCNGTTPR
jgi:hypothetical protein